ncbi:hypothetical protein Val02_73290 [Virgisporangium aliadipatigenens]|uniref:FAD-dependent urate hydroxylase HpyO/Asp monooxygenase CreE-like FAD/NAD(P)-binding domain-containing protein n=1 Tax=Virgisporangium aliadipatigenens TaxID=741659 RepID=A0A8J4DUU3_9ACTN|nr:FAD/NAD(P)-binding protein [Virgisporangium aliadipatigenens]GIJ50443.1 hypothetical protein Val02_73290 [Virgisporangium aliadipatigenens]
MGKKSVLVVGGGCSGTLAAIHLLRTTSHRVTLVEAGERPGRGIAYGTTNPAHLLNSRAAAMSVASDDPQDFVNWCARRDPTMRAHSFAPRHWYGTYLQERLSDAAERAPGRLDVHRGRVRTLRVGRSIRSGEWTADRVVLATGHPAPGTPDWATGVDGPRYVADPWDAAALERLPLDGPVLLVGTGLTAVDVMLTLAARGASLIAVSRHGLLPLAHTASPGVAAVPALEDCGSLAALIRNVRRAAEGDWRSTVDALRPEVNAIWHRLDPTCRERFLRHVARHWEVHRHRMAPAVAARVSSLLASGALTVRRGRIRSVRPVPDGFDVDGSLRVGAIVNCTGPGTAVRHPLLASLVATGAAVGEPLGLGVSCDPAGRVNRPDGTPWENVHLIGPARRGTEWETTAVPEIRTQAEELAGSLA